MKNTSMLFMGLLIMTFVATLSSSQAAFAAIENPSEYLDRRVLIWNLFFKMMTVAFTVGAVVSGTLIWQIWRFRESHPKAKPTEYEGKDWQT